MEEAAISETQDARYELGNHESIKANAVKAIKHWIIKCYSEEDASIKPLIKMNKKISRQGGN